MHFKYLAVALFVLLTSQPYAAEVVNSKNVFIEPQMATKEDLLALKTLLKREFYLQTIANKNDSKALSKLEVQLSMLGGALEPIHTQASTTLKILRITTGLLGLLLTLQLLGFWLLKRRLVGVKTNALAIKKPINTDELKSPIEDFGVTTKTPRDEAIVKAPLDPIPAADNSVSILNIRVEKATPFFGDRSAERNTKCLQYPNPPISTAEAFVEVNKIKAETLERAQKLRLSAHFFDQPEGIPEIKISR